MILFLQIFFMCLSIVFLSLSVIRKNWEHAGAWLVSIFMLYIGLSVSFTYSGFGWLYTQAEWMAQFGLIIK